MQHRTEIFSAAMFDSSERPLLSKEVLILDLDLPLYGELTSVVASKSFLGGGLPMRVLLFLLVVLMSLGEVWAQDPEK